MIKNVSNDTRYIIKRILIGVGIALILGFIKTNNVFAESVNSTIKINDFGLNSMSFLNNNCDINIGCSESFLYNNINFTTEANSVVSYIPIYWYSSTLNEYYIMYINLLPEGQSSISIDINSDNVIVNFMGQDSVLSYIQQSFSRNFLLSDNLSNVNNFKNLLNNYNSNYNIDYIDTYINSNSYYLVSSTNSRYDSLSINLAYLYENFLQPNNFIITYTDPRVTSIKVNDNEVPISDLPINYTTLDLTDYNAVYFLPKDYSTIPTRDVDNHIFIDFPFYFKGAVNYGYFNLVNNEQIVFLPLFDNLSSSNNFTLVESSFPMFYDDTDSNLDDLNAFIIYNIGGVTQVAYNNNLFDYYLIKDLNSYSQEITYIDNLGNSVTKIITFTQTLEEMWESGFSQDSNNWWNAAFKNKDKLNNYIQLLKLPYRLFVLLYNKIIGGMCTDFVIPFPHLGNIRVPCLSVVFRNVLGNNFFSAFKILINTFYVIAIVFANVKFLMKQLSPELIWFGNNL